jgi:hypothetical protein
MNTTSPITVRLRALALAACLLGAAVPLQHASAMSFRWGGDQVQGSGTITRQAREVGHFTGLSLAVPGNVELRIGNHEGVTVETDDNLQALVETVVENGTLQIRPAKRNVNLRAHTLKIVVQARNIERVVLAGSGTIEADPLQAPRLQFDVGGSGSIKVKKIEAETVAVSVGGSGDIDAGGGSARELSVSIAGSGKAGLGRLKAASASIKVAGSGEATVWAASALSLSIAGSGDVSYYGDPTVSSSVLGSGNVRRLGAAPI